jgi:hypothetical protein
VGAAWWKYQQQHTGVSYRVGAGEVEAAGHFWVAWNKLIEQWLEELSEGGLKAGDTTWSFRIEDIDLEWPWIRDVLKLGAVSLPGVPRNFGTDSKRYEMLRWADLKSSEQPVRELAAKYGYSMDEVVVEQEEKANLGGQRLIRARDDWRR